MTRNGRREPLFDDLAALAQTLELRIAAGFIVTEAQMQVCRACQAGRPIGPLHQAKPVFQLTPAEVAQLLFTGYPI